VGLHGCLLSGSCSCPRSYTAIMKPLNPGVLRAGENNAPHRVQRLDRDRTWNKGNSMPGKVLSTIPIPVAQVKCCTPIDFQISYFAELFPPRNASGEDSAYTVVQPPGCSTVATFCYPR